MSVCARSLQDDPAAGRRAKLDSAADETIWQPARLIGSRSSGGEQCILWTRSHCRLLQFDKYPYLSMIEAVDVSSHLWRNISLTRSRQLMRS